jgi:alpha-tubulin suppressor-like RCC1 family protein
MRLTPVPVAGGLFFSQVSAGYTHTCGRTPAAVAYCWGSNGEGQLGTGTPTSHLTPAPVAGGD